MWGTMRKNGEKISVLNASPCLPHKAPMSYPYLFSSVLTVPGTVFYLNWLIRFIETKFLFMFPCIATCLPHTPKNVNQGKKQALSLDPVSFTQYSSGGQILRNTLNKWFTWRYTVELKERKELPPFIIYLIVWAFYFTYFILTSLLSPTKVFLLRIYKMSLF